MNRRAFIGTSAAGMLINSLQNTSFVKGNSLFAQQDSLQPQISMISKFENIQKPLILPRSLKTGSTVGITASASPSCMGEIAHCINYLKKMKCKVVIGESIKKPSTEFKYFAAPDEERADEFMEFIARDDIDAVIAARGGFGVMRILPLLDYDEIRKQAKPIIGFSDITALVNSVYKKSNLVSFHGPVASLNFSGLTAESFSKVLFGNSTFKPAKTIFKSATTLNKGIATGKLVGGNLSMITATLGTPYEIDTKDSIFFIEEVLEEPYKIDRMLTQLWLAGKLDDCNAIIIGKFKNLDKKKNFFPNYQFTVRQILDLRIKSLNKPSLMGLPIGHDDEIITLPIGILAEVNATEKSLTFLESCTSI